MGLRSPLGRSRRYRLASGDEGRLRPGKGERLAIHGGAVTPQVQGAAATIFRDGMRRPAGAR
jgi:hypothetical protein